VASPTFVTSAASALNTTTTPKTVTVSVQAGDLLVIASGTENAQTVAATPTATGYTFTDVASSGTGGGLGQAPCHIWTAVAPSTGSVTVSVARTGSAQNFGFSVSVWRNHNGIGPNVVATGSGTSTSAPSASLTTTAANSALDLVVADWTASTSTRTYRTPSGGTSGAEDATFQDGSSWGYHRWHHTDAGSAGAKTVGMSAPTQRWNMVGVEVLGAAGGPQAVSGTVAAVSGASGAPTSVQGVGGTVAATSSAAGAPTSRQGVSGTVPAVSSASGSAGALIPVSGTVAAVSGVSGAAGGKLPVSGTVAGTSAVSGSVTAKYPVSGTVAATSAAAGSVTLAGHLVQSVSGVVSATSTTGGAVSLRAQVSGAANAVSNAIGEVHVTRVKRTFVAPSYPEDRPDLPVARPEVKNLFNRMPRYASASVLKTDGLYRQVRHPTAEEIGAAEVAYIGGHEYTLSEAERDDLVAAGYGPYITETLEVV
jgi:hypothetical protein